MVELHEGAVEDLLPTFDQDSFDGVMTDPPYGLAVERWDDPGRVRAYKPRTENGYGNKGGLPGYGRGGTPQDREAFRRKSNISYQAQVVVWATLALRVCKPGAWLIAFGAARTAHRLASGIEDAGWEIRDSIDWQHQAGIPKNRASELAPAHDLIVLARKPLSESTIVKNVQRWGVGDLRTARTPYPTNHVSSPKASSVERKESEHVHVKPVALCEQLASLILPASGEGRLLVPFCGSGSEIVGACRAGWTEVVGIERDAKHLAVCRQRTESEQRHRRRT